VADQDIDGITDLYCVPINGGTSFRLTSYKGSPGLPPWGDVYDFRISPDGTRVIYRADRIDDRVWELYSVAIGGSLSVRLNENLETGEYVGSSYDISPDGTRVVFGIEDGEYETIALYSAPLAGVGPAIKLAHGFPPTAIFENYLISPDSSRVVFTADGDTADKPELFSVRVTGGTVTKLNTEILAGSIRTFRVSPDGSRVVYAAYHDTELKRELYSVPSHGGAPTKLNHPLGTDEYIQHYAISPTGARAIYIVHCDTHEELYSVPVAGGTAVHIDSKADLREVETSPDGKWVLYKEWLMDEDVRNLYSVPIEGGDPVRINSAPAFNYMRYKISPDGSRVVYQGDIDTSSAYGLYSNLLAPKLYFPHVDTRGTWSTGIAVVNTHGTKPLNGTLMAYDANGEAVGAGMPIHLPAHGRMQMNVGDFFVEPAYMVLTADSFAMCGYTKFASNGEYRVAVPAVQELNYNAIPIPHVASDNKWWTGAALVNATPQEKTVEIACSDGTTFYRTLGPYEHQAFTFSEALGGSQPGIASAEINNAPGVIGLELFGHKRQPQLSGVLLTDRTAQTLYFPHVDITSKWWTGIVAYNPEDGDAGIDITCYDALGTVLDTQAQTVPGHSPFIGAVRQLGLPATTAWLMLQSDLPITGFELFGTNNGLQLAGYTAVGIEKTAGVFPKLEKDGWTGIAFVNTGTETAVITLYAYNNAGILIAQEPITLIAKSKLAELPEAIFPDDISGATCIAYTATQPVVGFQLNGSANGMMLDGLPGM
jgi:Tol biopolymer transport system component